MHENNGKPEALLWIDFETTGVDRRKSLPLEIGMECTDMLGEQKFGSLSRIIRPDRLDILSMSPVAFSMHTDNGLLFELMGGTTARSTGTSNAMTATSPTVERLTNWKPQDGTSTEIAPTTASVRTTTISHAANAASGTSDRCTGSNTRDGSSTPPTPTTASAPNASKPRRKQNEKQRRRHRHQYAQQTHCP